MTDPGEWPRCPVAFTLFGERLECALPQHHAHDGSDMHQDEKGNQWSIAIIQNDGTEVSL